MASVDLIHAIAATAELCGTSLTESAAKLLLSDLSEFEESSVVAALSKCRKELKGRLTLAEIISRIDDGRPGPEEAWAILPRDEATTVVWTDEICEAWGIVRSMIDDDETVAARMAFKESYTKLVAEAREAKRPAKWSVSLGHDEIGRRAVLLAAVAKRRLTADFVNALLPSPHTGDLPALIQSAVKKVGIIGPAHAVDHYADTDR